MPEPTRFPLPGTCSVWFSEPDPTSLSRPNYNATSRRPPNSSSREAPPPSLSSHHPVNQRPAASSQQPAVPGSAHMLRGDAVPSLYLRECPSPRHCSLGASAPASWRQKPRGDPSLRPNSAEVPCAVSRTGLPGLESQLPLAGYVQDHHASVSLSRKEACYEDPIK